MRLITTCLRWELAEQPPVIVECKSIEDDGINFLITYEDGHQEKIPGHDHEMTHRIII